MDRFPKMLYRFPALLADAAALQDGKYDQITVDGEEAHDAALAEGFHETPADARLANGSRKAAAADSDDAQTNADQVKHDETAPPTRDELKTKAKELGLTFAHNITTDKLAALVTDKLKG